MGKISRRDAIKFLAAAGIGIGARSLVLGGSSSVNSNEPKYYGRFRELPVGSVRPKGWIKSWLERQAVGLGGHPEDLAYPYDTCMYTGKVPPPAVPNGQIWWPYEQSGYFVDAATRLSLLIDNPRVKELSRKNLDFILEHSGSDHLGESYWGWPSAVVGRALTAQHGATGSAKIADVLTTYLKGEYSRNSRDGYGFEQALYLYGLNGDAALLDIAQKRYEDFFLNDPKSFSHIDKIRGSDPIKEHGVTSAEQLKLLPLLYSHTGNPQTLELAKLLYRKVVGNSLMPDGGMVSSESLGTTAFNSLHETCDITDWSWSFGYMLMADGEAYWGDRIEQAAFNALPGAVTKDFRQLQYFSSANQVLASNTACPRIGPVRMAYRAAHDTPCCSGNVSRLMPNYVARMWMSTDDGLAAALYGPSRIETTVSGQAVTITEQTNYPFGENVSFDIQSPQPVEFALHMRIPEWCSAAAVTLNGKSTETDCRPGTFAVLKRKFKRGDVVELKLPMAVKLENWFGRKALSVNRGPLVYSLKIDEKRVESAQDTEEIKRLLKGHYIQGIPALEFFPQSEWRYGLEKATATGGSKFRVRETRMSENPFANTPVSIEVPLRFLPGWESAWRAIKDPQPTDVKLRTQNPAALPTAAELSPDGQKKTLTLVPYGATHLRVTTLPLI